MLKNTLKVIVSRVKIVEGGPMVTDSVQKDISPQNHRPVTAVCDFHRMSEGSVFYQSGNTRVLCTASIDNQVPDWMRGKGSGWLTAEYQMHPRSNPKKRERRDGRGRAIGGRSQEIQRLIGRSLRAAVDLKMLGEKTITIDCDVLEADGGTRTASITGGYIALCLALHRLRQTGAILSPVLVDVVTAISVGEVDDQLVLDLCYEEDSRANVDLNLVATENGAIVEVQGTAEGRAIPRERLDALIDLGLEGTNSLAFNLRQILNEKGISLDSLLVRKKKP
ncbi:MAG: ribonuclease PH [Polyangiaceae bacterium]|nr:ribonuclease PH [Polyangiaceae bacterium]